MNASASGDADTRLLSLDVFRGLVIAAMILVTDPGTYGARYAFLCHSEWAGPTATDIISPAFLLMVGMALPFSLDSRRKHGVSDAQTVFHILRRTVLLVILGLFLNGLPEFHLHTLRLPGILQHIAVCYLGASLLCFAAERLFPGKRGIRSLLIGAAAAALLILYAALLRYFPVPGFGPGRLDSLGSLPAYVDRAVFGVRHLWAFGTTPGHGVTFDPDGLLSCLSGVAIMLVGVLATGWLRDRQTSARKLAMLIGTSAALIASGYALGHWMPLIKKLWTPTFAVFSTGVALLVFATLYLFVDLLRWTRWAWPFRVFGTNAIYAFAVSTALTTLSDRTFRMTPSGTAYTLHRWAFLHLFATWLAPINASLAYAVAVVFVNLTLVYPLYRKRVFLRL